MFFDLHPLSIARLKILLLLAVVNRVIAAGIPIDEYARRIDRILRAKRELLPDIDAGPNVAHGYVSEFDEILRMKRELSVSSGPVKIDVTGKHSWMPPGANDERGPCPAANALANHGFIPRNGVCSVGQVIAAAYLVFGLGMDMSFFLGVYSGVTVGCVTHFSIGGKSKNNSLGLGDCQGLKWSHNRFETDASPTRMDFYKKLDAFSLHLPFFKQLLDMTNDTQTIKLEDVSKFRNIRLQHSIETNPYFFFDFVLFIVFFVVYQLPVRLLKNSLYNPCGADVPCIDHETMKSFYAVTGNGSSMTYNLGYERIPDNWYRVPVGEEYSLAGLVADMSLALATNPNLLKLGGNTGKVNSFAGVDLGNLTGGVYNAKNLLEGTNLECFIYQSLQIIAFNPVTGLLSKVAEIVTPVVKNLFEVGIWDKLKLGCPKLQSYNRSLFSGFPGYSMSNASCSANTTGYD